MVEHAIIAEDYSFEPKFVNDANICLPKTIMHNKVNGMKWNNNNHGDYPLMYVGKFKLEITKNP